MSSRGFGLAMAAVALSTISAQAAIVEVRFDLAEPFAEGKVFGQAGSYVRIKGVARGELNPDDPANRVIVDLDKAPRNARGMVEYETDVFMLRPSDPAKGSGIVLYDVTNRGRKFLLHWINEAKSLSLAINDPKTAEHAGNGFAFERGYTVVWSGWDPDAPKAGGGLTIRVPVATEGGKTIVQRIRNEFVVGTRGPGDGMKIALPYPAANVDSKAARLTVRTTSNDERTEIAPDQWAFIERSAIRLTGEGQKFQPLKIYELWYEAQDPKILGIGFAATRDLVSFLRHERTDRSGNVNPALISGRPGTGIRRTVAVGISQSGRYLRHHLELGMNADEKGRRVFDGMLMHISGAGKVFANHRFGMPNRTATQHEDRSYPENWFPFGYARTRDPITGREGSLLTGGRTDPKIIEVNTSTEYWQKGASLVHSDPDGRRDLKLPANVRMFLIAGTQHGGRVGLDSKPGLCVHPRNPHNPGPALRALMVALEQWVTVNRRPPASRIPFIASRSAVPVEGFAFPSMAGLKPPPALNPISPQVSWIDPPDRLERGYGARVPQVDADGNEIAGIRLPPIAVPLGTYTGWNMYSAAPTEMCDRDGAYLPFARTRADREGKSDPRPSLEERYKSRDDYAARVKAVAEGLVRQRLLLPRDAEGYAETARSTAF